MRRAGQGSSSWRRIRPALLATLAVVVVAACTDASGAGTDSTPSTVADPGAAATIAPASTATATPDTPDTSDTSDTPVETASSAEPAWVTGDPSYLFDQALMHTFEIDLPTASLAELDADPSAEEYVEGSLTFDGETVDAVDVRYKGSVGAFVGCTSGPNPLAAEGPKTCTKLSMKLRIDSDGNEDRTFYGVRKVLLHAMNLDGSLMHERLGYWLFREMGVPAPRATHARVLVNGEYLGVFALVEEIDGRFTREAFDDGTGNLYKEVWPFDASGAPPADEVWIDALETNRDEDPTPEIISSFAAELLAAPADAQSEVLARRTDLDTLLTTFVVDRAIGNDDGALHWYCFGPCEPHNFFWYEHPTNRTVHLVPWDLDNAFDALLPTTGVGGFVAIADPWGQVTNDCEPFPFGTFGLLQRSAACDPLIGALVTYQDEYDAIRADLLAGPFADESIREQLDTWSAQIEDAVAEAAAAHDDAPSVAQWRAGIDTLLEAIEISRNGDGR
ncbi:MAG: CotH kinase family protein [Acidimicrobiales bacterium]|nr:CotH kinase family protein [Acidimicrobiales bacterium]MCB9395149.1 CotH kinase family protein [Acidimicrobiaceae bacterium]